MTIEISRIPNREIHVIRPLWEKLNQLHEEQSDHFKNHFSHFSFEQRIEQFNDRDDLAVFTATRDGDTFGYCIASVKNRTGEIDSIFIRPVYQKSGIGEKLLEKAESWLNSQDIDKIHICVAQGNELAFGFYAKYGFFHRFSVLEKPVHP